MRTVTTPQFVAREAILFVTDPPVAPQTSAHLLAETLERLAVHSVRQRVVALAEQPLLGMQYHVRVTPCLLLDLGARRVQLTGDPQSLDAGHLEAALARR